MKYIDLAPTIKQYRTRGPITGLDGESYALKWLDEHPDQVPGLATVITRSQWDAATKIADQFVVGDIANAWGLSISDSEPTNLESISKLLTEFAELNASCGGEQGDHDLAEFLDARGVQVGRDD